VPEMYRTFRQSSRGFCIGLTIEQFYTECSNRTGPVLNYS